MLTTPDGQLAPLLAFETVGRPAVRPGAELVARVLGGLQKTVWLLAAIARPDGREPGSAEKKRLELTVKPTDDGYVLGLGGPQLALALAWATAPAAMLAALTRVWDAVAAQDFAAFAAIAPDLDQRKRLLNELKRLFPRPAEAWSVSLAGIRVGPLAVKALERHLAAERVAAPAVLTVTGELLGVDFDHGTFSLRYAATRRTLTGKYAPDAEVWLLKHRRKPIQVDGEFALDALQRPQSCVKALRFRAVDLSPLTLSRLALADGELVLEPPLTLAPQLDEATGQRFEAREDALGVFAVAATREALEQELAEQVALMWTRYGEAGRAEALADPVLARMWRRRARLTATTDYREA